MPEARKAAGDLLIRWLNVELNSYRGGIYQIPPSGEPSNSHHLHHRSIYRALTDYLRCASKEPVEPERLSVLVECLRVLSYGYSKPLPPFNWSFMQDLLTQDVGLRKHCLALAAKQAMSSPSAKRLVENYISVFQPSVKSVRNLYSYYTHVEENAILTFYISVVCKRANSVL